jgi:hypothetical protein
MQKTKTFKYLFPSVYFDDEGSLSNVMDRLAQKNCLSNAYISDVDYEGEVKYKLFLLIKNNVSDTFTLLLPHIKKSALYCDHYHIQDQYYMLVLHVNNHETYDHFIHSRYSEMYTIRYLKENFKVRGEPIPAYHVLAKTEERRQELIKDWGLKEDFEAPEYDSLLDKKEEFFNKAMICQPKDTMTEN